MNCCPAACLDPRLSWLSLKFFVAISAPLATEGGREGIVITGSDDKTARVWRLQDGTELFTLSAHTDKVSLQGGEPSRFNRLRSLYFAGQSLLQT